jgi:hypothetical protein
MSEASSDSLAVFAQRAKDVGFSEDDINRTKDEGIASLAKFGFACRFAPGQADEAPLIDLGKPYLGKVPYLQRRWHHCGASILKHILCLQLSCGEI